MKRMDKLGEFIVTKFDTGTFSIKMDRYTLTPYPISNTTTHQIIKYEKDKEKLRSIFKFIVTENNIEIITKDKDVAIVEIRIRLRARRGDFSNYLRAIEDVGEGILWEKGCEIFFVRHFSIIVKVKPQLILHYGKKYEDRR